MGDVSAYKVASHRHVPEVRQSLRRLAGSEVTLTYTPTLAPMPRGILATCTARTSATEAQLRSALDSAYADEPFVHVLPQGRWPRTASTAGSNACQLQVPSTRPPAGPSSSPRWTTSARAPPGRRCSARTCCSGCRRRPGSPRQASHRERLARPRLPRRRRHRRPQGQRPARPRAGGQRRPAARQPPACSPPTGSRPRPCCGSQQVVSAGRGRRRRPELRRRQRLHRTRRLRRHAPHRRGRRRPRSAPAPRGSPSARPGSSASGCPWTGCCPASTAAAAACPRDGGPAAAEAIRTTDTVAKTARRAAARAGRSAGWPRARRCSHRRSPRCSPSSRPTRSPTQRTLDAVLRARHRRHLRPGRHRRLQEHQRHGAAAGQRGQRHDADAAELDAAVAAVCHDLARQMVGDAEGASKDIAVEVVGAASVDDALEAARAVGRSNLLKCALHGQRPELGPGARRRRHDPRRLRARRSSTSRSTACRSAAAGAPGDDRDLVDLSGRDVHIVVDLHAGAARPRRSGRAT